ncbi:hypothetical protein Tco_0428400 [Tanacetum coccineum]
MVEHIEYFLKIVDPINLPNVNYERLRLSVFLISLVGNASEWFDEFKGSISSWIINDGQEGVDNKEFSDAKKANNDYEQETVEICRNETKTKTYKDYENKLNDELEEPWSEDGVPYEICDHICEPFCFKNWKAKWPTCNSNEDGFCNGGELSGMVQLQEYWWKVNDHECSPFSKWRNHIQGPYTNYYSNFQDEERCELFKDQERPVCNIRRFEMIKYSFEDEEEYVAVKADEYDDFTSTSKEAIRTYQEIFCRMDEGWIVTRAE